MLKIYAVILSGYRETYLPDSTKPLHEPVVTCYVINEALSHSFQGDIY